MIDAPPPISSSADARLELAVAAAARERANRPRWLIVLGVLLLVASAIFSLTSITSRLAIWKKVYDERKATDRITDIKDQLDIEAKKLEQRGTARNDRMGQQIEQLAAAMGVGLQGPVTDSPNAANTLGLQQHTYTARCQNQDAGDVLKWLMAAMGAVEMPGLEITHLVFRPGGPTATNSPGWNVEITFSRWETTK